MEFSGIWNDRIVCVNNHSEWRGWTPFDYGFPSPLLISGREKVFFFSAKNAFYHFTSGWGDEIDNVRLEGGFSLVDLEVRIQNILEVMPHLLELKHARSTRQVSSSSRNPSNFSIVSGILWMKEEY